MGCRPSSICEPEVLNLIAAHAATEAELGTLTAAHAGCDAQVRELVAKALRAVRAQEATEAELEEARSASPHIREAFVAGASWWEVQATGGTMWGSDRTRAEKEAERRFPNGEWVTGPMVARLGAAVAAAERERDEARRCLNSVPNGHNGCPCDHSSRLAEFADCWVCKTIAAESALAQEREGYEETKRERNFASWACSEARADRDRLIGERDKAEANLFAERARAEGLERVVREASEIAESAPELNPSNYDHDQACELNDAMIRVALALRAALARPADERKGD